MDLVFGRQTFFNVARSFLNFPLTLSIFISTVDGKILECLLSTFAFELIYGIVFKIQNWWIALYFHLFTNGFVFFLSTVQFSYINFTFVSIEKLLPVRCEITAMTAPWSIELNKPFWAIFCLQIIIIYNKFIKFGQIKFWNIVSFNLTIWVLAEHVSVETWRSHILSFWY